MPTHEQYYLTCTECGDLYQDVSGNALVGETPEEVRGVAEDDGWACYQGHAPATKARRAARAVWGE